MSCCDPNGLNGLFKGSVVEAELRDFKKRGLGKRQRAILEALPDSVAGRSVLDIGCGVGGLGLSLLARGAAYGTFVDVSRAYLQAARELAEARVSKKVEFVQGDFVQTDLSSADIVFLDRVVCCYPDAPTLLRKAAAHSEAHLTFSYPRPTWWMHLVARLLNSGMWAWRKDYRFYVHGEDALLKAAKTSGHTLRERRSVGVWRIATFAR